jgi:hypothetical protein
VSAVLPVVPRAYLLAGLCGGYALLILFNPVRTALRDGLRCCLRYKRVWLPFIVLGLCYNVFQFSTFSPIESANDFDLNQVMSLPGWHWPRLWQVWTEVPLPTIEGVAGIFDNATTTYPVSVVAAALMLLNWRRLPSSLWAAMRKDFRYSRYPIYFVLLLSAVAAIAKAVVFMILSRAESPRFLQISASIDASAFIFEYLFGVYVQVYIITVCLVWVRGVSFNETALFQFAVRRFAYVLKWAAIVVCVSTLFVRTPLLLAYFINVPRVLDYLPYQRMFMSILIIVFASVQVSLALHNEHLFEAVRAHFQFVARNSGRFGWFLLLCALHFAALMACDAVARNGIADRIVALIVWKCVFVTVRGLLVGWLLASWVCLFRQCEARPLDQEDWIRY